MTVDQKMAAFDAVAKQMMDDAKRSGIYFHVIVKDDLHYRFHLEYDKSKRGWTMGPKTTLKEFEKIFRYHLEEIIKIKPKGLFGL